MELRPTAIWPEFRHVRPGRRSERFGAMPALWAFSFRGPPRHWLVGQMMRWNIGGPATGQLGVIPTEVVNAADGGFASDAGMGSVMIVMVEPCRVGGGALGF